MATKYLIEVVINKEKLSDGNLIFVAHCPRLGIASQGYSTDDALKNIKEAIELYLEDQPEKYDELAIEEPSIFSMIEVTRHAEIANSIG
ncbi:MAG TPA: type II toxin-antitoxin system HicB family antitoxin [Candidatus Nanoarchaeia archaeon]|nr:type II toxin-antitoxin system HicB family antitoxin [Candidatus Nanoarchaeia archaeon]